MKKIIPLCVLAIVILSPFIVVSATVGQQLQPEAVGHICPSGNCETPSPINSVPDEVLVRFKPEARINDAVMPDIATAAHSKVGATIIKEFKELPGLQLVKVPNDVPVPDALTQYKQNPNVLYAEPNYICYKNAIPNDPYFKYQWGLRNTGQNVSGERGTPGADIRACEAWDKTTGSNGVIVAVLDTGIDYRAPDLAPNIINGWDFITNSSDPMDRDGHGTHVAGIIAAVGNNGIGVTGVMWKAKIMPLRVIGPYGAATDNVIEAIDYANSHGARIINMSFGGYDYSLSEKDAIDASPSIFICSAGNDGVNTDDKPYYPACYESSNIIAVTATDQSDSLASFSDYGPNSVQVAAPGTHILSTFPPMVPVFFEPFKNLSQWDSKGWDVTNALNSDNPRGATASSSTTTAVANATMTLKNSLDLTGKCGTTIDFTMWLNTTSDRDSFYIQTTTDDIHWRYIDGWWGNSDRWFRLRYSLTAYDNSPHLKIRFVFTADGQTSSNSSVYLDKVTIDAFDPSSVQQNYVFYNGNSMATAYVSGLAGLVRSMSPNYTNLQIKDLILKNVDVKSSLTGKILTGGRINASKTLSGIGSSHVLPLLIPSARLVPHYARHFECGLTTAGAADAQGAPYTMFDRKAAIAN